jgi:hypothetical protein
MDPVPVSIITTRGISIEGRFPLQDLVEVQRGNPAAVEQDIARLVDELAAAG